MKTSFVTTGIVTIALWFAPEFLAANKVPPQCAGGSHSLHFENAYRNSDVYECELDKQEAGGTKMCREWEGASWSPTVAIPCGSSVSTFEVTRLPAHEKHATTGAFGRTANADITIDGIATGQEFEAVNALLVQHGYHPLTISTDWLQSRCTSGQTSSGTPNRLCNTYRGKIGASVADFRNPDPNLRTLELTFVQDGGGKYTLIQMKYAPPKTSTFQACYQRLRGLLGTPIRSRRGWANWEVGETTTAYGQPTPRYHVSLNDNEKAAVSVDVIDMQLTYALIHAGQSQ